ncbi:7-cyano-7-deazaguanine synthase QueC [Lacticaseibacillus sp. GG6-2]
MHDEKALVVFSGGQDSTTCLFWAKQRFASVSAVTFDYGQRNHAEIACAQAIAKEQGISHHVLDMQLLNQLAPSALTRSDIAVQAGVDGALPNTFVPGRNLLFLSFAGVLARQIGATHLVTGVGQADFSGYPDCRHDFIASLNVTLNLAMASQLVIDTPLMWSTKADTWALADALGVFDYVQAKTLTCYNGIPGAGCGECPACRLRANGLAEYLSQREAKS